MPKSFSASFPAEPRQVASIRHRVGDVARRCELDEATLGDVSLAVSEAATNAIVHGYRGGGAPAEIHVDVNVGRGEMAITVTDDGVGLAPRDDSPGLGLGLQMVERVASRVEMQPRARGTRLRMFFPCPRSARR